MDSQDLPAWVGVKHIFQQPGLAQVSDEKSARTAALPFMLWRRVLVDTSRKAVGFVDNISGTFVQHSAYSDINSILWDLIDFGRGGRRGYSQKAAFIRGGLQQGF